jgi:hypothetical protein
MSLSARSPHPGMAAVKAMMALAALLRAMRAARPTVAADSVQRDLELSVNEITVRCSRDGGPTGGTGCWPGC